MRSIFEGHVFSELSEADIKLLDQKFILQIIPISEIYVGIRQEILSHGKISKTKISLNLTTL